MNYFGSYGISSLFGGRSSFYGSLGNYGSIRSGAYKKLMSSYYSKANTSKTNSTATGKYNPYQSMWDAYTASSNRAATTVKKEADELSESVKALTNQGSQSLFVQKETTAVDPETGVKTTTRGYDTEAIAKAVNSFVSEYNDAVKAGAASSNENVVRNTAYMTKQTGIYARSLSDVGITVGKDNTLSVNEDKLKSAGIDTLKRVFNGTNSFAAQTANRSNSISQAAARATSTASTYGRNGSYNNYLYNNYYSAYNWYL